MNKKGFTLIELLASIAVMTVIALISSFNIISIFDSKTKQEEKTEEDIITTAACVYIELAKNKELKNVCLTDGCDIDTSTLISEGILDEQDVSNSRIIHITKDNKEILCQIKK